MTRNAFRTAPRAGVALAAAMAAGIAFLPATTASAQNDGAQNDVAQNDGESNRAPSTYLLTGDAGGSKFEGIGADEKRGRFYVSETTGGEIHRGKAGKAATREWLGGDGTDERFTARGITVDEEGRVYIAGGPNGLNTGRPDLWVYDRKGKLLASLRVPGTDAFLNDVAIGPDGAAYFTDSNDAKIYRVHEGRKGWKARVWNDASDKITRQTGFNLGGIVLTPNQRAFVVAQGNVGLLWRFDIETGKVTRVRIGDADLVNADGLVLQGNKLTVVRNFSRMIATLTLSDSGRSAELRRQRASSPDRVLTTAKVLDDRILYVDSKFDEQVAAGPYEIITDPTS